MRRRLGLAALSGCCLALSFPKFGHWAVAWVGLVPLLVALEGATGPQALALGYVTGFVSAVGLLYWTALVVVQYGGLSLPVGAALMVLLCLAVALFAALFGWLAGRWASAFGPAGLLLSPLAWVATEMLRAHTLYRFSWCLLGYSQQPNLPFIQLASVTAVYGVSFVVAAASAVLAYALIEPRAPRRAAALAGLALGLGLTGLWGARTLARPLPVAGTLRVGLVQADILQEEKWDPAREWRNVDAHLDLTRRAASGGARLVVWPESALPFDYDRTPAFADDLRTLARQRGIYILFGNDDRQDEPGKPYRAWVGAKMITPSGELAFRYHKTRLVPFGEYVPMHALLTLGGRFAAKLVHEVADFTPGTEYTVGEVDGRRFGAFICYEAIFPDLVRRFAARGADLLVNMTNDAWYGTTSAPYQHFAMAVFRAVENGKSLVRAANTGISAVVDPRGRVLARTELFAPAALVRDVPIVAGETFYARHGDVFGWTCVGVAVALTLAAGRGRRPGLE